MPSEFEQTPSNQRTFEVQVGETYVCTVDCFEGNYALCFINIAGRVSAIRFSKAILDELQIPMNGQFEWTCRDPNGITATDIVSLAPNSVIPPETKQLRVSYGQITDLPLDPNANERIHADSKPPSGAEEVSVYQRALNLLDEATAEYTEFFRRDWSVSE